MVKVFVITDSSFQFFRRQHFRLVGTHKSLIPCRKFFPRFPWVRRKCKLSLRKQALIIRFIIKRDQFNKLLARHTLFIIRVIFPQQRPKFLKSRIYTERLWRIIQILFVALFQQSNRICQGKI